MNGGKAKAVPGWEAAEIRNMEEAVSFIYRYFRRALPHFAGRRDRERRRPGHTRLLLDRLGAPDRALEAVVVTGSKGKGSTSAFLASFLQAAGFRTGLFTGPHLVFFEERIRVDGRAIPEEDFVRLARLIQPEAEKIASTLPPGEYLGPVGLLLALALLWFREEGVEVAVLECGRGARHDEVPVARHRWAVITPVWEEHREELGPSLREIAWEKAGVITPGVEEVFSTPQREEVEKELSPPEGVSLFVAGRDFPLRVRDRGREGVEVRIGADGSFWTLQSRLPGRHQGVNLALAFFAARRIAACLGRRLGQEEALLASRRVRFPGRCDILGLEPPVLLDGAIHRFSAREVARLLCLFPSPRGAVVAVPEDKDWQGVVSSLGPEVDFFCFTRPRRNPFLRFPEGVSAWARERGWEAWEEERVEEAIEAARRRLGGKGLLAVVGTQSLLGEALAFWGEDPRDLW